jgi:hypothetical protein
VNERHRVRERAAASYRALAELAETVEDEWQYVNDLVDAYLPSIRALAGDHDDESSFAPDRIAAVDEVIAEIGLISDPHKAIDWLSTFPHVVALALRGDADSPAGFAPAGGEWLGTWTGAGGAGSEAGAPEPDDDSPFRLLLRDDR